MSHSSPNWTLDTYGCSRAGTRSGPNGTQPQNGDHFLVTELKRAAEVRRASPDRVSEGRHDGSSQAHALVVADGVSGHAGAAEASALVVDEIMHQMLNAVPWQRDLDLDAETALRRELRNAAEQCSRRLAAEAREHPRLDDMGSTLTMAFVRPPYAFFVHAGDSRAYLVRDGEIRQLTRDHTLANRLAERGILSIEEARRSPFANSLWNVISSHATVEPETSSIQLRKGDALLLCSDGLTHELEDADLLRAITAHGSAKAACEALADTARDRGESDDVTATIARVIDDARANETSATPPKRRHAERRSPPTRTTDFVAAANRPRAARAAGQ